MGFSSIANVFRANWHDNLFPVPAYMQGVLDRIERYSLPVIGLLHGYCLGLDLELALACDLRIASESAQLGLRESRIGLIPDVGGATRLTRLVGPTRAKDLIITGRDFGADYAERRGIVNQVVEEDALIAGGYALAEELVAAAPLAASYAKKSINGIADIGRGLQLEAWAQSILLTPPQLSKLSAVPTSMSFVQSVMFGSLMRTEDFANGAAGVLTDESVE